MHNIQRAAINSDQNPQSVGRIGAEPARQAGCQAVAPETAEEADAATPRHDHRPDKVTIQNRFSFEVRQPVQWRRIQPRT
jgi:hypothetical protein